MAVRLHVVLGWWNARVGVLIPLWVCWFVCLFVCSLNHHYLLSRYGASALSIDKILCPYSCGKLRGTQDWANPGRREETLWKLHETVTHVRSVRCLMEMPFVAWRMKLLNSSVIIADLQTESRILDLPNTRQECWRLCRLLWSKCIGMGSNQGTQTQSVRFSVCNKASLHLAGPAARRERLSNWTESGEALLYSNFPLSASPFLLRTNRLGAVLRTSLLYWCSPDSAASNSFFLSIFVVYRHSFDSQVRQHLHFQRGYT